VAPPNQDETGSGKRVEQTKLAISMLNNAALFSAQPSSCLRYVYTADFTVGIRIPFWLNGTVHLKKCKQLYEYQY